MRKLVLNEQEYQEKKILGLELKIKHLKRDIEYYKNLINDLEIDLEYSDYKINILKDKIMLLEVENTKLKDIIKN